MPEPNSKAAAWPTPGQILGGHLPSIVGRQRQALQVAVTTLPRTARHGVRIIRQQRGGTVFQRSMLRQKSDPLHATLPLEVGSSHG